MTESVAARKPKKQLSRRKKARAKKTLTTVLNTLVAEVETNSFLRSHLFLNKPDKDTLVVGSYIIVKTENGLYNVYKKALDNLVYADLYTFDAAMGLVEALNAGSNYRLEEIISADDIFATNYADMLAFERAYNRSVKDKTGNEAIFEDRYLVVSDRAQQAMKELKGFRIVKE